MKRCNMLYVILFSITTTLFCNHITLDHEKNTAIKGVFSGYVKFESYIDSRQVVGDATDQSLFFPKDKDFDPNGIDKNNNGQLQLVALESRFRYDLYSSYIGNANAHAVIEGDFISNAAQINVETNVRIENLLRLRHAFIALLWKKVTLLFGQTWHPIYIPECYSDTVSFNGGSPFDPYARMPQFRFTYHFPHTDIITSISSHITDFASTGPEGFNTKYIRNAIMPNLHGQIRHTIKNHFFGIGYNVKRLRPRLFGDPVGIENSIFALSEQIISHALCTYHAYHGEIFKICNKITYAENGTDFGLIGGFAIHETNSNTDARTYTNFKTISYIGDISFIAYNCIHPGLFFGYIKNIGTKKTIDTNIEKNTFGFGENIAQLFRIAPRCRWQYKNITFAAEIEYTCAAFGTIRNKNNRATITNSSWVGNTRVLFATYYFF